MANDKLWQGVAAVALGAQPALADVIPLADGRSLQGEILSGQTTDEGLAVKMFDTGGVVVVLGPTGRNFAAGMSGGIAYVYDPDADFARKCNPDMVALEPLMTAAEQDSRLDRELWHRMVRSGEAQADEAILKGLVERHFKVTGSTRARNLLDDWPSARAKFVKVFPYEYKRALGEMYGAKAGAKKEVVAA